MSKDTNEIIATVTEEQITALAAAVRRDLGEVERVHLDQLEQRIHDHRERFTVSLLEIGRCLNEAKDAGLVPHGCWQEWVAVNTGFNLRGAQRVMRAAREIPKTSTLTLLDFSKVSALLALPADERETFALANDVEHMSVRQLEAAIREKKEVEERLHHVEDEKQKALQAAAELNAQVDTLQNRLDEAINHPRVVEHEVVPDDYELLQRRDQEAAARIREAENYADEQEALVRDLRSQLDEARAQGGQGNDVQAFISACATFYGEVCRYQQMEDAELRCGLSRADRAAMRKWANMICAWAYAMTSKLDKPASVEVDDDVQ